MGILVGCDPHQLPLAAYDKVTKIWTYPIARYNVWYESYFPRVRSTFGKEEAVEFAVDFYLRKKAELKAYNFGDPGVFLHCFPKGEIAEMQVAVDRRLKEKDV